MPSVAYPDATQLVLHLDFATLASATASSAFGAALSATAQWLVAVLLATLLYWALLLWALRRRRHVQPLRRGTLLAALFLLTIAASALAIEEQDILPHALLLGVTVQGLFLCFFYVFPDGRFAPGWTRWLGIFYALSISSPFFPSNQSKAQQQQALSLSPTLLVLINVLSSVVPLTIVLLGILPQVYLRYAQLAAAGERIGRLWRSWVPRGAALVGGGFGVLLIAELCAQAAASPLPGIARSAQVAFFILASLLPVAAAFALLRRYPLDRDAITRRALIYIPLVACLILIYAAAIGVAHLYPGFRTLPTFSYLPMLAVISVVLIGVFRPLRSAIQETVDRRYYRRQYAAAQLLAESAATVATMPGAVRLDELCDDLIQVLRKALEAQSIALWLPIAPGQGSLPRSHLLAAATSGFSAAPALVTPDVTGADEPAVGESRREEPRREILRLHWQAGTAPAAQTPLTLSLSSDDPLVALLPGGPRVLVLAQQPQDSPAVRAFQADGAQLAVILASQGQSAGLLTLGPPPSPTRYTADERDLLATYAEQIAPVLHAARLAHMHDIAARERERVEQELQTARRIQESLLPKTVPALAGWQMATCYQPAREVGGDFYDFVPLADGRLGLILGDVTDKGIPAALVMATTRSMLRAVATQPAASPGQVLAQVNELLCNDLPASMFVTCFYAILDPATGRVEFANAGQDLPYLCHADGTICELRAVGMPLGLMPGMRYEEHAATLEPGDSLLFYSDGLVEAHNRAREMFGFPRLMALLAQYGEHAPNIPIIMFLLRELAAFTGLDWEQEDDITLVAVQRVGAQSGPAAAEASDGVCVASASRAVRWLSERRYPCRSSR